MSMSEGRKRFFHYMFTTALEGGIGYWSAASEYHWCKHTDPNKVAIAAVNPHEIEEDLDNFYAVIESSEDDWDVEAAYQPWLTGVSVHPSFSQHSHMRWLSPRNSLRIDLKVMERGWNIFMDKVIEATKSQDPSAPCSNPYFKQAVVQYLTDMEDGDSDANVADIVVQFGLFGDMVYA